MKAKFAKAGVTLVELLVAMAIVVVILSMVNAGYVASSKSAQYVTDNMTLAWRQMLLLENIAGQIRCAYTHSVNPAQTTNTHPQPKIDCFKSNPAENVLHLLTTRQFDAVENAVSGLLEVDYRFDRLKGALFLNERRFLETSGHANTQWRQIGENINGFQLQFFDGRQWLDNWDYNTQKNLPSAVRITIEHRQNDGGIRRLSTTVNLFRAEENRRTISAKTIPQSIK